MKIGSVVPTSVALLACGLALQDKFQGRVVEAETIRLISGGKVVWEVSATPRGGGARMTFKDGTTDAFVILAEQDVVVCKSETKDFRADMVIGQGQFSDSVLTTDMHVGFSRKIRKNGDGWSVERKSVADDSAVVEAVATKSIILQATKMNTRFGLTAKSDEAEIEVRVPTDLEVDAQIGGGREKLTAIGKLVEGIVVKLTNAVGAWSWSSKKD